MTDAAELVKLADELDRLKSSLATKLDDKVWFAYAELSIANHAEIATALRLAAQQDAARFEQIELARLARAFGVSLPAAKQAQDILGFMYRQRASGPEQRAL
jgi:hypothetical protein